MPVNAGRAATPSIAAGKSAACGFNRYPPHNGLSPISMAFSPHKMECVLSKLVRIFAAIAFLLATMSAAWSGDLRVGFINPTGPAEFWQAVNATMLAAAAELGINVDIRETGRSREGDKTRPAVSFREPALGLPDRDQ